MAAKDLALIIASLTISIVLLSSRADAQTEKIITEVCQQTEDFNFCSSTFNQNVPNHPVTIIGLNELTLTQALAHVTNTLRFVTESIPQEKNSGVLERLKSCQDAYNTVQYSLKKAFVAFNSRDYSGMQVYGQAMLTEQSRCYENFNEAPFNQQQVHEMSREVKILITMAVLAESYLVS